MTQLDKKEVTIEQAFDVIKKMVLTGVTVQGSFEEIKTKNQAVEELLEIIEDGIKSKENGE
tara:strand:- start:436 stop:618 length:183 start_codon:yes stop_codon:yes gene_type:complete